MLACSLLPSSSLAPQATPAPTAAGAGPAGASPATKTPLPTPAPTVAIALPAYAGFEKVEVLANDVFIREAGLQTENIIQSLMTGGQGGPGENEGLTPIPAIEFKESAVLISGFKGRQVADVTLQRPDGSTFTTQAIADQGELSYCLDARERAQIGEYQITIAVEDQRTVSGTFAVDYSKPTVFVGRSVYSFTGDDLDRNEKPACWGQVKPEEAVDIFYAGFKPDELVQVHLYPNFIYFTSWTAQMDENGRLVQHIEAAQLEYAQNYVLIVETAEAAFLEQQQERGFAYKDLEKVPGLATTVFHLAPPEKETATPAPTLAPSRFPHLSPLAHIPAGKFKMGSEPGADPYAEPIEFPQHTVDISDFWIETTEVSNAQYEACVEDGACTPPLRSSSKTRTGYYGTFDYQFYPVVNVTYAQAAAYCQWGGGRLPTEAEWEKAAGRTFFWKAILAPDLTEPVANYGNLIGDTSSVGFNFTDDWVENMAGNVWEWVSDWFAGDYYAKSPANDPTGPAEGVERVVRGGAFSSKGQFLRLANRYYRPPDQGYDSVGFRCVTTSAP
jgi:formylglycine-generating enzyme required for sulfatase activity